jgi:hypothetical protein
VRLELDRSEQQRQFCRTRLDGNPQISFHNVAPFEITDVLRNTTAIIQRIVVGFLGKVSIDPRLVSRLTIGPVQYGESRRRKNYQVRSDCFTDHVCQPLQTRSIPSLATHWARSTPLFLRKPVISTPAARQAEQARVRDRMAILHVLRTGGR